MKYKMLLVGGEEKPLIRQLRDALPPETWELAWVANPNQAVAKARTVETDLIVMALDSRESAGWEAIDEITEMDPCLPVMVVTQPELKDLAEAVGARAWVEQPVNVAALMHAMRQWVDETVEKRRRGGRADLMGFPSGPASAAETHEMLHQRATAPFAFAAPYRHWGDK